MIKSEVFQINFCFCISNHNKLYIHIYVDNKLDLNLYKVIVSAGKYPILGDFLTHFLPKYSFAVSMATGMKLDEISVD